MKLQTFTIDYSRFSESKEYPDQVKIKAKDLDSAEKILENRLIKAGTESFIINRKI